MPSYGVAHDGTETLLKHKILKNFCYQRPNAVFANPITLWHALGLPPFFVLLSFLTTVSHFYSNITPSPPRGHMAAQYGALWKAASKIKKPSSRNFTLPLPYQAAARYAAIYASAEHVKKCYMEHHTASMERLRWRSGYGHHPWARNGGGRDYKESTTQTESRL